MNDEEMLFVLNGYKYAVKNDKDDEYIIMHLLKQGSQNGLMDKR